MRYTIISQAKFYNKFQKSVNKIRLRTYIAILPLVAATATASGFLSFFEARTALTRMANRHLAYKAEQLRDYINNEWQIVEDLKLSNEDSFRSAAEDSFVNYAYSVLRSASEEVLIFDSGGKLLHFVGGTGLKSAGTDFEDKPTQPPLATGWFERKLFDEERVGIAFDFSPFGWTVAVAELRSLYFGDINAILRDHLVVLVGALFVTALLLAVYLRRISAPLESLTRNIERITATEDFTLRLPTYARDEIGVLGDRFNQLLKLVEDQQSGLVASAAAERGAHETARQRETETLYLLGRVSEYKDAETGFHLVRLGTLSALFSRILGHDQEAQELMLNSAPLHDIGKIGVSEAILQKPAKLTAEEFELIKLHTVYGYELLRDCRSRYLAEGAIIAHSHHERWDGSGYPRGLAGEDIPLSGRIVSIMDVYDALISVRPYKTAWTPEEALAYILEQRGRHFDPHLVDLFEKHFEEFRKTDGN